MSQLLTRGWPGRQRSESTGPAEVGAVSSTEDVAQGKVREMKVKGEVEVGLVDVCGQGSGFVGKGGRRRQERPSAGVAA